MDLFTLTGVLRRHWVAALLGLVATIGATLGVAPMVDPSYRSTASVVLLSPGEGNPYLGFPSSLKVVSSSLVLVITSDAGTELVEAHGGTSDYDVTVDGDGAIISVTATAPSSRKATKTVEAVLTELDAELARRQSSVAAPDDQRIRLQTVTAPARPTAQYGSRTRAMVAVSLLGVAATVGLTYALEGLRRRRAERAEAAELDALMTRTGQPAADVSDWTRLGPLASSRRPEATTP